MTNNQVLAALEKAIEVSEGIHIELRYVVLYTAVKSITAALGQLNE